MKSKFREFILPISVSVPFLFVYYYFALPAINLRAPGFYAMLIITALVFIGTYLLANNTKAIGNLFATVAQNMGEKKKRKKDDG